MEWITFLVHFDDIFNLVARPGGQDFNQRVVISASALGRRHKEINEGIWDNRCGSIFLYNHIYFRVCKDQMSPSIV